MGLLKTRAKTEVTRKRMNLSGEVNSILMAEPYLMTFVHMLKHYETLPEDADIIACTDGTIVEYGPKFRSLELPERTYICVHEIGHGTFLHSQRAMLWMMYNGFLFPALWNYAADVVINEGIESNPMMRNGLFQSPKLFPPCRMQTTIHDTVQEVARVTGESPPSDYSPDICRDLKVETLYEWLVWALFAIRRHRGQDPMTGKNNSIQEQEDSEAPNSSKPGSEGSSPSGETKVERMEKEDAWDLREHVEDIKRMIQNGETPEQIVRNLEKEIEEARARIQQAVQGMKVAGQGQGSMLMNLSSDLPKPTIPWYRIIRHTIDGALGTKMQESYTRPGNATLCAMALGKRDLPVSRGMTIFSPRPKILCGLDVSGSMLNELRRCCAEIWSMAQMKNAEIDLLTWDSGIQEKLTIAHRSDFDRILSRGLRGGGGTTLIKEVFDYAEQHGHQAIVIMTDGYVNISLPQKPRIPVIWAVTPGGAVSGLKEYGTIVPMKPEPSATFNIHALAA